MNNPFKIDIYEHFSISRIIIKIRENTIEWVDSQFFYTMYENVSINTLYFILGADLGKLDFLEDGVKNEYEE